MFNKENKNLGKTYTPTPVEDVSDLVDELEEDEIVMNTENETLKETLPESEPEPVKEELTAQEISALKEVIDHAIARALTSNKKVNDKLVAQKGILLSAKEKL